MAVPGSEQPNPSPNPDAAQPAPRSAVDATKYVGTPAVGTSKAAACCRTFVCGSVEHGCRSAAATSGMGGRDRISHRMVSSILPVFSSPHSF